MPVQAVPGKSDNPALTARSEHALSTRKVFGTSAEFNHIDVSVVIPISNTMTTSNLWEIFKEIMSKTLVSLPYVVQTSNIIKADLTDEDLDRDQEPDNAERPGDLTRDPCDAFLKKWSKNRIKAKQPCTELVDWHWWKTKVLNNDDVRENLQQNGLDEVLQKCLNRLIGLRKYSCIGQKMATQTINYI